MDHWVILLRGINVGGTGRLPMADLRAMLAAQGCQNVQTYIQSGNATTQGPKPDAKALSDTISTTHGFRRPVHILSATDFGAIARACPYIPAQGKDLYIFFCTTPPLVSPAVLQFAAPDEQVHSTDTAVYLHAPSGIGRSKLAEKLQTALPPETTARNANTIDKLLAMTGQPPIFCS